MGLRARQDERRSGAARLRSSPMRGHDCCVARERAAPCARPMRRSAHRQEQRRRVSRRCCRRRFTTRVRAGEYVLPLVPVDAHALSRQLHRSLLAGERRRTGASSASTPETGGLTDVATGKIPDALLRPAVPRTMQASDPQAATKIVHNYRARRMQMDGDFHTFDLSDVDAEPARCCARCKILLSQRYYVGTTADPPATLPDNTESRQLGAALAPKDLEGVGVLTWRFNDWTTWDQVWAYLPTIRRVRRVRSSTRGDRIPGFEVQGDDADCYDNKTSYFTWKLVRRRRGDRPDRQRQPVRAPAQGRAAEPPRHGRCRTTRRCLRDAGRDRRRLVHARQRLRQAAGVDRRGHAEGSVLRGRQDRHVHRPRPLPRLLQAHASTRPASCTGPTSAARRGAAPKDGSFAAPTALLMLGVNEKENRGTPAGRFTRETFDRGFAGELVHHRAPGELSSAISGRRRRCSSGCGVVSSRA